jgi:hypothetical protein
MYRSDIARLEPAGAFRLLTPCSLALQGLSVACRVVSPRRSPGTKRGSQLPKRSENPSGGHHGPGRAFMSLSTGEAIVRLVRSGGMYLANREAHHRAKRWRVVATASVVAIALAYAANPLASLFVLPFLAAALLPIQRQLARLRRGMKGEASVTSLLGELSDKYLLVNDVMLPGHRGNVDHVLIGPCGVVVIETKEYRGVIACRRDRWFVNGRPTKNITRQVTRGALAVKAFLAEKHPELRNGALRWVDSVVVFTNPLCRIEIDRSTATVTRASQLQSVIRAKAERPRLTPSLVESLAKTLAWGAHVAEPAAFREKPSPASTA